MRGGDDKQGINRTAQLAAAALVKLPCCCMPTYVTTSARLVAMAECFLLYHYALKSASGRIKDNWTCPSNTCCL